MSEGAFKRLGIALDADFTLGGGAEDAACVDLELEWSTSTKVFRHSSFTEPNIEFVSGEVGDGGDHVNITFKNTGTEEVTVPGSQLVAFLSEDPDEKYPECEDQTSSQSTAEQPTDSGTDLSKVNREDAAGDQQGQSESVKQVDQSEEKVDEQTTRDEELNGQVGESSGQADESSENACESTLEKKGDETGLENGNAESQKDESDASTPKAAEETSLSLDDTTSGLCDEEDSKAGEDTAEKTASDKENTTASVNGVAEDGMEVDRDTSSPTPRGQSKEDASGDDEPKKAEGSSSRPVIPAFRFVNETEADEDEEEEDDNGAEDMMDVDEEEEKEKDAEESAAADDKADNGPNQSEKSEADKSSQPVSGEGEEEAAIKETGAETSGEKDKKAEQGKLENGEQEEKVTLAKVETAQKQEQQEEEEEEEEAKRPTIKLASFADISEKETENHQEVVRVEGCGQCGLGIESPFCAIVWETMQYCNINCLAQYQSGMSNCSSCKKVVNATSLGKYCVRFGSDIKQFCSNVCLEDYKKGLKVCSYCQKDISGGEGFLAPIGDKGQFKDFCEQNCMNKYEVLHLGKVQEKETTACSVCKETRVVEREIIREKETIKLCPMDSCFSAYKFVNSVKTDQCGLCKKHFDLALPPVNIYYEGCSKKFCSKACQNVYVMTNRKIVPCANCKVKKYNFDMIEKYPKGKAGPAQLFCSLNCLRLLSASATNTQPTFITARPPTQTGPLEFHPLPVISAISSLAVQPELPTHPIHPSQLQPQLQAQLQPQLQAQLQAQLPPLQPQIQVQTQTIKELVKETVVLPQEASVMKNKGLQTKPYMINKGVSCRPHPCHKSTQTEGLTEPTPVPVAVPIHVPTPCKMYNAPFPVPVPIPLPFPVPIFIPTTRNSMKGIMKQIKKIQNKIPADPFEAELLALAGNIAAEDQDSSGSGSEGDGGMDDEDEDGGMSSRHLAQPAPDLESEMEAGRILPKPLPTSTPEPPGARPFAPNYNNQFATNKRRSSQRGDDADDPDSEDETWRPQSAWDQKPMLQARQPRKSRGRTSQPYKRPRSDTLGGRDQQQQQQAAAATAHQQPRERPDANHHLKFTYGVNAWKHWVVGKNAELEKQRAQGKYQKSFETDILKLRADELNFTLCMFVKEVKKPNGDSYAADSIFYLVLGIQEYLFENGRIDNIFTDVYYDPFTTALHEVVKDFKLPVNELGYFVTRIEEEHLWESKQLGAHSPHVLLNTLVYFNTKYFQLKTVEQHLRLSFSHIMKHWKKSAVTKTGQQQRTVLLRYYPPPAKGQKNDERRMYEQHENHESPLRCPVKLYEFYLSKCPESTKNRNDMFYLQPERSCVPDSPVWYSIQLLNKFSMEKMLARLLMVREVQEHMLADQA